MNHFLGMKIQNKIKRQYYLNIFLNLVPEFFFSLIFCFFWSTSEKVLNFLLCFITLQILYLILWVKDSIWQWVFFSLNGRKIIAKSIYNYFKSNNFPEPAETIESSLNYIENIVDNEQIPINARLRACYLLALKNYLQETNQFQQLFRTSLAIEDAIELYKTDFKNN